MTTTSPPLPLSLRLKATFEFGGEVGVPFRPMIAVNQHLAVGP